MKPENIKHYSKGSKLGNVLMTRFRTGRTGFYQHKYSIGQAETPECICHAKSESPKGRLHLTKKIKVMEFSIRGGGGKDPFHKK